MGNLERGLEVSGFFTKLAAVLIGSFLVGTGINGFLVPHHLLDGGIIGIALILHYYLDVKTGLWMAVLSLPLSVYAWFKERNYFYSSFQGLIATSFFIDWLSPLKSEFLLPIWLSSIIGGVLIGTGVGLMLRFETSTGGTDLLAYIIQKTSSMNLGTAIFLIDGLVVLIGFKALGAESLLFSVLTIFMGGTVASIFYEKL
ncbi:YitT family protein [Mesobacillus foraminis]|nr:YitT family protein [Mesobacillus foraminis]